MSVYENGRRIAKEQRISLTDLAIKSGLDIPMEKFKPSHRGFTCCCGANFKCFC